MNNRLYSFYDKGIKKYGFRNQQGQLIIAPIFDSVEDYSSGFYRVWSRKDYEGIYGYVGRDGSFFPPGYSKGDSFMKGHVYWLSNHEFGHLFRNGRFVPNRCAEPAVNGVFVVNKTASDSMHHMVANLCGDIVFDFGEAKWEPTLKNDNGYTQICMNYDDNYYYHHWYIEPDGIITKSKFDGSRELYHARVKKEYCYINNDREIIFNADAYDISDGFYCSLARARKKGKCSYIDQTGNVAIPFTFDDCSNFSDDTATVYYLPPELKRIDQEDDFLEYRFDQQYLARFPQWIQEMFLQFVQDLSCDSATNEWVIHYDMSPIFPGPSPNSADDEEDPDFSSMPPDDDDEADLDHDNEETCDANNDLADRLLCDLVIKNHLQAQIDIRGNTILQPRLYPGALGDDKPVLAPMKAIDGKLKFGYINQNWETVIEPIFDYAREFEGDFAKIEIGTKHGIIDRSGKYILQPIYDWIITPLDELPEAKHIQVRLDGRDCIVNFHGKVAIQSPGGWLEKLTPELYQVHLGDDHSSILNIDGKTVLPNQEYFDISKTQHGLVTFCTKDFLFGAIDRNKVVIEAQYRAKDNLLKEIARVYPDTEAQEIVADGKKKRDLIAFRVNGLWGYKNIKDVVMIPPLLDDIAMDFHNGYAWVVYLGKMYRMHPDGALFDGRDRVGQVDSPLPGEQDGMWGYTDRTVTFVIPPMYDKAGYFNHDFATVTLNGWEIRIDCHNKVVSAVKEEQPPKDI